MSVLRNLETKIAGLVEGTFGRVFRSEVRPVELARKLAREMDQHKTVSVSRTYVPNEYVVWLSTEDRGRYEGVEHSVQEELGAYLLEHARRERYALVSTPAISFQTDDRLGLGEFGIQARTVSALSGAEAGGAAAAVQADHGRTMIYSTAERVQEPLREAEASSGARRRGVLLAEGKRLVVPAAGATIGRSRDCDIVLEDHNVSRRHAQIRPAGRNAWTVEDLGSTNGVRVNGRSVERPERLNPGDELAIGTVDARFEVE
jgi:hypothetical protein